MSIAVPINIPVHTNIPRRQVPIFAELFLLISIFQDNLYFYPQPDEVGAGVMASSWMVGQPAVRLSAFCFRSRSRKPMWDFFHIAYTHLLGGVHVPVGVFEF